MPTLKRDGDKNRRIDADDLSFQLSNGPPLLPGLMLASV
jgi:hypothetical protein